MKVKYIAITIVSSLSSFLALCSCSTVMQSSKSPQYADMFYRDHNIGFYYLPQKNLKFSLKTKSSTSAELNIVPVLEADFNHKYFIQYDRSLNSSDDLKIELSEKQTIKSINIESEETTVKAILSLIDQKSVAPAFEMEVEEVTPIDISIEFDPLNPDSLRNLNEYLDAYEYQIQIADITQKNIVANSMPLNYLTASGFVLGSGVENDTSSKNNIGCIFYKVSKPYQIGLYKKGGTDWELIHSFIELFPSNEIQSFDFSRDFGVKTVSGLTYDNFGVIHEISVKKPSTVVEAASLPINVAKAFVSVVTEVIQLKIDINDKNKDFVKSQKELIDIQKELEDLNRSLVSPGAENSNKKSEINPEEMPEAVK